MAAGRPACAADERQDAEEPAKSLQGKYSSACSNKGISRPNAAAWLLVSLLGFLRGPASAQRSKPVSNTNQFAAALQDASISEIILDPSGAGTGGGTLTLEGAQWLNRTYDVQTDRYLTIRSVNGNPTMLDLSQIPRILNIQTNATLELRDLLIKNISSLMSLSTYPFNVSQKLTYVSGMLTWPSFYGQPGGSLRLYNTTQYFWSQTLFRRADCNYKLAGFFPSEEQVQVTRGQQIYNIMPSSGYTSLAETGLYQAFYPVSNFFNHSEILGYLQVNSENGVGYCVPTNGSVDEVIAGLARASASAAAGVSGDHTVAIQPQIDTHVAAIAAGSGLGFLAIMGLGIWQWRRLALAKQRVGLGNSERSLDSHGKGGGVRRSRSRLGPDDVQFLLDSKGKRIQLGRGSFGAVYKARWNGILVAAKFLLSRDDAHRDTFMKEVVLLETLRHPNVINYLGHGEDAKGELFTITEYMQNGSLADVLHKPNSRSGSYGWYQNGKYIALGVARGLAYLHSQSVVHFDIKPQNILIDHSGVVAKISDMGLSRILAGTQTNTLLRGTLDYMAWELFGSYGYWAGGTPAEGFPVTSAVDIFSFGVMLWEVVTHERPDRSKGALRQLRVPEECPEAVALIIQQCSCKDPSERPTATALMSALEAVIFPILKRATGNSIIAGP